MARVNVEQKALTDSRYNTLGRLIGADRHAALGRMILVWNECQERETIWLSRTILDDTNPDIPDFSSHVIASGLAQEIDGEIRISGAEGRVEWLSKLRNNGKLGGRPKKNQKVSKRKPSGSSRNNPPAPVPTPAPTSYLGEEKPQQEEWPETQHPQAQKSVESFAVEEKHRKWAEKECPLIDVDKEVGAWRDRLRITDYTYGKARTPIKSAQGSFYTHCRVAQQIAEDRRARNPDLARATPVKPPEMSETLKRMMNERRSGHQWENES